MPSTPHTSSLLTTCPRGGCAPTPHRQPASWRSLAWPGLARSARSRSCPRGGCAPTPHRQPASWRSLAWPGLARSARSRSCPRGGCAPTPHRQPASWRSLAWPGLARSARSRPATLTAGPRTVGRGGWRLAAGVGGWHDGTCGHAYLGRSRRITTLVAQARKTAQPRATGASFASALAAPVFRRLLAAFAASALAQSLGAVAVAAVVYQRTGSAAWVAVTASARLLPYLLCSGLSGALADRCRPATGAGLLRGRAPRAGGGARRGRRGGAGARGARRAHLRPRRRGNAVLSRDGRRHALRGRARDPARRQRSAQRRRSRVVLPRAGGGGRHAHPGPPGRPGPRCGRLRRGAHGAEVGA